MMLEATLAHRKYEVIVLIYFKMSCFLPVSSGGSLITNNTVKVVISTTKYCRFMMFVVT